MAIGLTISNVGGCQRSEGSGHNEIDHNAVSMQFMATCCIFCET